MKSKSRGRRVASYVGSSTWGLASTKNRGIAIFIGIALFGALSGCNYTGVSPPSIKLNPAPKAERRVVIRVESSEMNARAKKVKAVYQIENTECLPLDKSKAIGGVRPNFSEAVLLDPIEEVSGEILVAFKEDYILPEDYYGMGRCLWGMKLISVEIDGSPKIIANFSRDVLMDGRRIMKSCALMEQYSVLSSGCIDQGFFNEDESSGRFTISAIMNKE